MQPTLTIGNATVYSGNNLDILPTLPDNSVDSIVCDPPYELGFMGKSWDSSGIAYSVELWRECLRVLKPGGHLLAFGGTRTWHRLAVAVEDAGFEIRDNIAWLYGSGFPKSHNISKAIDKKPEMTSTKSFKLWLENQITASTKTRKQIDEECGFTACSYAKTDGKDGWSSNHPSKDKWKTMKQVIGLSDEWDWIITDNLDERGFIEPTGGLHGGTGNTVGKWEGGKQLSDNSVSPDAKAWDGWGTALKPAHEPIVVARKPVEGTIAENVLKYGVGALNIDATRIGTEELENGFGGIPNGANNFVGSTKGRNRDGSNTVVGRWPANIILDEYTAELLDEQSDASRFFYVAKASKKDRNEGLDGLPEKRKKVSVIQTIGVANAGDEQDGKQLSSPSANFHPTVKPTALMQYLIRLVTPENGVVLDPFTGSGSTGKAAILENKHFIGIELTAEYLPIIEGRLTHAHETMQQQEDDLFE